MAAKIHISIDADSASDLHGVLATLLAGMTPTADKPLKIVLPNVEAAGAVASVGPLPMGSSVTVADKVDLVDPKGEVVAHAEAPTRGRGRPRKNADATPAVTTPVVEETQPVGAAGTEEGEVADTVWEDPKPETDAKPVEAAQASNLDVKPDWLLNNDAPAKAETPAAPIADAPAVTNQELMDLAGEICETDPKGFDKVKAILVEYGHVDRLSKLADDATLRATIKSKMQALLV